jgi:hypothetical protein
MDTRNKDVQYLIRKKELENQIDWYNRTISEIEKQQSQRRRKQYELVYELYKLEGDYYGT